MTGVAAHRLGRRPEALLAWAGRAVILALVLQVLAVDHWSFGPFHPGPDDEVVHEQHCHGAAGGCVDTSAPVQTGIATTTPTVLPPEARLVGLIVATRYRPELAALPLTPPPRLARIVSVPSL